MVGIPGKVGQSGLYAKPKPARMRHIVAAAWQPSQFHGSKSRSHLECEHENKHLI
jgi:hypothetical protein